MANIFDKSVMGFGVFGCFGCLVGGGFSAPASAKPTKPTENDALRDCPPLLADLENSVPADARARFSPNARLGEASECPLWRRWSLPGALCAVGGRSAAPFVPSVVISGCPVCGRWSLPGALSALGGRFRAPVVASLVASGRPLCRWWSLLDALCAVSGHFRAPFWRHNVTKATCNCAQM